MLKFLLLISCLLFTSSVGEVTITWSPPILIGENLGVYAHSGYRLGLTSRLLIEAEPQSPTGPAMMMSDDLGATWHAATHSCASTDLPGGRLSAVAVPQEPNALRGFGSTDPKNPFENVTHFTSQLATLVNATGSTTSTAVTCTAVATNISFVGLPHPAACAPQAQAKNGIFGCPFRLTGSGITVLRNGSLLASAIIHWGDSINSTSTSIVSYISLDGNIGAKWAFIGVVADASDFPLSQEGPNENALAQTSDGSVICVMRLDAGDGPLSHPYVNYVISHSYDNGAHWGNTSSIPNAGCARPRLLHLGAAGNGTVTPAPLLLSGGRWRNSTMSSSGWDILIWVNENGLGNFEQWGGPWSVSSWHNSLVSNDSWRFSSALNDSSAPRQSTSYTSIIELDENAQQQRSRRLGITYNRQLQGTPDMFFFMPFTLSW